MGVCGDGHERHARAQPRPTISARQRRLSASAPARVVTTRRCRRMPSTSTRNSSATVLPRCQHVAMLGPLVKDQRCSSSGSPVGLEEQMGGEAREVGVN